MVDQHHLAKQPFIKHQFQCLINHFISHSSTIIATTSSTSLQLFTSSLHLFTSSLHHFTLLHLFINLSTASETTSFASSTSLHSVAFFLKAKLGHHGSSPLHLAAESDSGGVCAALLACAADPQLGDDQGDTALHCAVLYGSPKVPWGGHRWGNSWRCWELTLVENSSLILILTN